MMFESNQWISIIIYICGINLIALLLMGLDKRAAMHHQYRISEKTLLGFTLFGGALGIWAGMRCFHHKTKKPLFMLGVPLILGFEIIALLVVYFQNMNIF